MDSLVSALKQDVAVLADDKWLGYLDSNQGMTESKSVALPLGYTPSIRKKGKKIIMVPPAGTTIILTMKFIRRSRMNKDGAGERNRTLNPLITSQVLCQLSYTGDV
jgi:hypothetical protein